MTADIDPAFADRCAAAAINLRQLAELGARPEADANAMMGAAALTAELLADPEALLAVALTIEQARAAAEQPIRVIVASVGDPARVDAPPLGAAWTRDNWLWCGCAGPHGKCPNERCTNHKDAPR